MRLIDSINNIFSHNEIIAIWEKEDEHHDILVWCGMAWQLPEEYKNIEKWQIVGAIADKITESDRINININDAAHLIPTIDAVPVVRCKECKHWNQDEVFKTSSCRISYDEKGFEKQTDADFFCGYGKRKDGE